MIRNGRRKPESQGIGPRLALSSRFAGAPIGLFRLRLLLHRVARVYGKGGFLWGIVKARCLALFRSGVFGGLAEERVSYPDFFVLSI